MQYSRWDSWMMQYRMLMGLARYQTPRWRTTISSPMRCVLAFACFLFAALPAYFFAQLPTDWLDLLLPHVFTPQGAFLAFALFFLAAFQFAFATITCKVTSTL